jgi:acyl-coenzyme A synthetase/AMP-(fatty) acid ligase
LCLQAAVAALAMILDLVATDHLLIPLHLVAAEELGALCRDRLSRYKVPKEIRFVAALPRNSMGKVLRRELRASLAAEARG